MDLHERDGEEDADKQGLGCRGVDWGLGWLDWNPGWEEAGGGAPLPILQIHCFFSDEGGGWLVAWLFCYHGRWRLRGASGWMDRVVRRFFY